MAASRSGKFFMRLLVRGILCKCVGMALLKHPASGQLGNAGVPAPWLFRADRCRRGAPTARLYAHSMWLTAERVREENSSEGDGMASITRRSRDIPGTDAHPNISGAC